MPSSRKAPNLSLWLVTAATASACSPLRRNPSPASKWVAQSPSWLGSRLRFSSSPFFSRAVHPAVFAQQQHGNAATAVALVKIGKIEPGVTPTYESVASQVKKELATERARIKVVDRDEMVQVSRGE